MTISSNKSKIKEMLVMKTLGKFAVGCVGLVAVFYLLVLVTAWI